MLYQLSYVGAAWSSQEASIARRWRRVRRRRPSTRLRYDIRPVPPIDQAALAIGAAYLQAAIDRGLDVDGVAPRFPFNVSTTRDFFEEIAKHCALRRLWAGLVRDRFGAGDAPSWMLRLFSGGDVFGYHRPSTVT